MIRQGGGSRRVLQVPAQGNNYGQAEPVYGAHVQRGTVSRGILQNAPRLAEDETISLSGGGTVIVHNTQRPRTPSRPKTPTTQQAYLGSTTTLYQPGQDYAGKCQHQVVKPIPRKAQYGSMQSLCAAPQHQPDPGALYASMANLSLGGPADGLGDPGRGLVSGPSLQRQADPGRVQSLGGPADMLGEVHPGRGLAVLPGPQMPPTLPREPEPVYPAEMYPTSLPLQGGHAGNLHYADELQGDVVVERRHNVGLEPEFLDDLSMMAPLSGQLGAGSQLDLQYLPEMDPRYPPEMDLQYPPELDQYAADVNFPIKYLNPTDDLGGALVHGRFDLEVYHSHKEIHYYLLWLAKSYQSCSIINIGRSKECRPLLVLMIGDPATRTKKPGIFIDAGLHGREWLAPATALILIYKLVTGEEKNDPSVINMLTQFNFFILPVANPDGYEFSRNHNRMWRKTRSGSGPDGIRGVDPNRNFDYKWGGHGSSRDPSAENYCGPSPCSEPCVRAMRDFLWRYRSVLRAYLSLHTFGRLWCLPYGDSPKPPPDVEDMIYVAGAAARAMERVTQRPVEVRSSYKPHTGTAGCSKDWAKGKAGIKYSYTVELGDRREELANYMAGHIIPESLLAEYGEEMWVGLKAFVAACVQRDGELRAGLRVPGGQTPTLPGDLRVAVPGESLYGSLPRRVLGKPQRAAPGPTVFVHREEE